MSVTSPRSGAGIFGKYTKHDALSPPASQPRGIEAPTAWNEPRPEPKSFVSIDMYGIVPKAIFS